MSQPTAPNGSREPTPIDEHTGLLMLGVWSAIVYIMMILGGWAIVAGFVPPISPDATNARVAEIFREDTTRIRVGMLIVMFSALAYIPFGAVLCRYVRKAEGGVGMLTFTVLLGGVGNMVLSFAPAMIWLLAAFEPERDPAITSLINDAGWFVFVGGVSMIMALPLGVAATAFLDRSSEPTFPRWAGWLNLLIFLVIIPDQALFFFHSGPFAWNGLFGLWIPVTAFAAFFFSSFYLLRVAILRDRDRSLGSATPHQLLAV